MNTRLANVWLVRRFRSGGGIVPFALGFAWWVGLTLPLPASAWNAAGHRLIATIGWSQLDAPSRAEVSRLLDLHPDRDRWRRRSQAPDDARAIFIAASTWADDIRHDRRFVDGDRSPATTVRAGFPDMERHRDWHFVNRPQGEPALAPGLRDAAYGQLDVQLEALSSRLETPGISDAGRADALVWLIHLVGDAHQPLHASDGRAAETLPMPPNTGEVAVASRASPRASWHAYWDNRPGPAGLRGDRLDATAEALLTRYPRPAPSSPAVWVEESWRLAGTDAWPSAGEAADAGMPAFVDRSGDLANQRIVAAGYRLADLLHACLRPGLPAD